LPELRGCCRNQENAHAAKIEFPGAHRMML
jgi:hypothetical protein